MNNAHTRRNQRKKDDIVEKVRKTPPKKDEVAEKPQLKRLQEAIEEIRKKAAIEEIKKREAQILEELQSTYGNVGINIDTGEFQ